VGDSRRPPPRVDRFIGLVCDLLHLAWVTPPHLQEEAVKTVLQHAELLSAESV
jgi:hypothetical protein